MAYRMASTRNPLGWRPYNFMLSYYEQAKFYVPTATPVGLGTFPNFASARPGPWLVRDNRSSPVPRIYRPAELVGGPPLLGWLSPLVRTHANQNTYTYHADPRTGKMRLFKQDIFPRGVWAQDVFQKPAGMGAFDPRKRYLNGLGENTFGGAGASGSWIPDAYRVADPSLPPWLGPIPGVPDLPPLPNLTTLSPPLIVQGPKGGEVITSGGNTFIIPQPTVAFTPAQGPPPPPGTQVQPPGAFSRWLDQTNFTGFANKYLVGGLGALVVLGMATRKKGK